jgi:PEP-CTERM motif
MKQGLLIMFALGCATLAHAGAIQWTLQNVTFDDGGTASGTFFYDADTNTYSNIDIVTTAGLPADSFTGTVYLFLNPNAVVSGASSLGAVTASLADGSPYLGLSFFPSVLTDAGGTIALSTSSGGEASCISGCLGTEAPNRFFTGGDVFSPGASTPEPSSMLLFGLGLASLPCLRRRASR